MAVAVVAAVSRLTAASWRPTSARCSSRAAAALLPLAAALDAAEGMKERGGAVGAESDTISTDGSG